MDDVGDEVLAAARLALQQDRGQPARVPDTAEELADTLAELGDGGRLADQISQRVHARDYRGVVAMVPVVVFATTRVSSALTP